MSSPTGLTDADVTRILHLIDNLHDVEVRVEVEGMKLHVRKFSPGTAVSAPPLSSGVAQPPVAGTETGVTVSPASARTTEAAASAGKSSSMKAKAEAAGIPPGLVAIRAPMLGRFFRAPSPTETPYVDVGSRVDLDDTVCMIEVMKLFNTVKAGVRGTIESVTIQNGDMVEYDSVLFWVKPS